MYRSLLACLGNTGEIAEVARTSAAPLLYDPARIFTELCQHECLLSVDQAKTGALDHVDFKHTHVNLVNCEFNHVQLWLVRLTGSKPKEDGRNRSVGL